MALPRSRRFPDRRAVRALMANGATLITPLGRIRWRRARGRVLFVVSTYVSKKSSERHRIKRELEHWVERFWRPPAEVDAIISVSRALAAATRAERWRLAARSFELLDRVSSGRYLRP